MNQTRNLLLAALCAFPIAGITACGVFNLMGTNEDGTPKTPTEARDALRLIGDVGVRTWGTDGVKKYAPGLMATFDKNGDGILTLLEVEGQVDASDPESAAVFLTLVVTMLRNRP